MVDGSKGVTFGVLEKAYIFVVAWQSPLNFQVQPSRRRPPFVFRMDDHYDEPQPKRFKVRIFSLNADI